VTREDIVCCLSALAERLARRGIQGELYLVGGAAMALAYNARRATRDVDAVFAPKDEIDRAAREVAEEQGLPEGWLNDAVKGFLAGPGRGARMRKTSGFSVFGVWLMS